MCPLTSFQSFLNPLAPQTNTALQRNRLMLRTRRGDRFFASFHTKQRQCYMAIVRLLNKPGLFLEKTRLGPFRNRSNTTNELNEIGQLCHAAYFRNNATQHLAWPHKKSCTIQSKTSLWAKSERPILHDCDSKLSIALILTQSVYLPCIKIALKNVGQIIKRRKSHGARQSNSINKNKFSNIPQQKIPVVIAYMMLIPFATYMLNNTNMIMDFKGFRICPTIHQ